MGMMFCKIHGWSGISSLTRAAAKVFDDGKNTQPIIEAELSLEGIPFFVYALDEELPFADTLQVNNAFEVNNETILNDILGGLSPRCSKCVKPRLK